MRTTPLAPNTARACALTQTSPPVRRGRKVLRPPEALCASQNTARSRVGRAIEHGGSGHRGRLTTELVSTLCGDAHLAEGVWG